jgi:hypothetical protein
MSLKHFHELLHPVMMLSRSVFLRFKVNKELSRIMDLE